MNDRLPNKPEMHGPAARGPRPGSAPGSAVGPSTGAVPVPDPLRRSRVFAWVRRATIAGLVLTLLIHAAIALLAGWWRVGFPSRSEGDSAGDLVEFAVISEADLAAMTTGELESDASEAPLEADDTLADLDLFDASASAAVDELVSEPVEIEIDTGGGDFSGDEGEIGEVGGGGSLGGASFFGLAAQGTRFAYVVDKSSSMKDDAKMMTTKRELSRSISALEPNAEYLIMMYSSEEQAGPLEGSTRRYRQATEFNVRRTREAIEDVQPQGGTYPLPAFEGIYAMRAKPDAIYFMTDGEFTSDVPARVAQLNRRYRIPIHTILFGNPSKNARLNAEVREMMERIARQSNGNFIQRGVGGGRP